MSHDHANICKIILVRHGTTQWNVEKRLQGEIDIPLNDLGREQAHQLREKLAHIEFDAVYTSDLSRASETTEIVMQGKSIPIIKTPELRESRFGSWEGSTVSEFKTWLAENNLLNTQYPQEQFLNQKLSNEIENHAEVYRRVTNFIRTKVERHLGKTIFLGAHGGVLCSVLYHHEFTQGERWKVTNCAWIELHVNEQGLLEIINKNGVERSLEPLLY
jgi:broad specificity phosphatase PhoE